MSLPLILGILLVALLAWRGLRLRARGPAAPERPDAPHHLLATTGRQLYTRRNFLRLVGATAAGAALSYSGIDETFDEALGEDDTGSGTAKLAHIAKEFGENEVALLWIAFLLADRALPGTAIGRWGRECFCATATGLPVLWSWQRVLGASRPSDQKEWGPRYRPFTDENSVSGHTFLGAIPFLVAARHVGAPLPAWGLRALSPVTGWSRLHDHRHYLSQVLLGWGLAAESVRAATTTGPDATSPPPATDPD